MSIALRGLHRRKSGKVATWALNVLCCGGSFSAVSAGWLVVAEATLLLILSSCARASATRAMYAHKSSALSTGLFYFFWFNLPSSAENSS
jgi:hypothetical protein